MNPNLPSGRLRTLMAAAVLPLLAACATTAAPKSTLEQELADRGLQLGEPLSSVPSGRTRETQIIDGQHVIADSGGADRYLITFDEGCSLGASSILIFDIRGPSITTLDIVRVKDGPSAIVVPCRIQALNRLQRRS